MTDTIDCARRRLLRQTTGAAMLAAFAVLGMPARASSSGPRSLALVHTHTGEQIDVVYALDEGYVPAAMATLNHFLRDHYSGEVGIIDPLVFDQLHRVQQLLGSRNAFEVISGYRCPATNARLRSTRGGGVARNSLHLQGRAIDVRLPGLPLAELHDAALSLQAGGVGFYPREQFVHFDTGRVRSW
jgi:uncharacterized protein YcbK (DUF882 family)